MQFRDWPRTMRRASYKGAHFYVEKDTVATGRRLVVHEFPLKDEPYVEDLGRDANKISVTAYVVSNQADAEERRLRAACESYGAGTLVLPLEVFRAHCQSCSRDFTKDKLGYIAFSLSFVREGSGGGLVPAAFLGSIVSTAASALVAAAGARLLAGVLTAGVAGWVRDAAVDLVRDMAATLDVLARGLPLDPALAADVVEAIGDLYDDAESLASIGEATGSLTRTRASPPSTRADRPRADDRALTAATFIGSGRGGSLPGAADASGDMPELVARLAAVIERLRLAVPPETFLAGSAALTAYAPPLPLAPPRTPSRRRIAENAVALGEALRLVALAAWAEAAAARVFTDRRQAIQARADAAEMLAAEMEALGEAGRYHARVELADLSARLADYLSRRIADLAPVIAVEAPVTMPSLWWANRVYGGADRAGEIVARNRVIHASFMPTTFEALSR